MEKIGEYLGVHLHLGINRWTEEKYRRRDGSSLRKTWGPANLSQVGEQVWYEQMDMRGGEEGGRGEGYSSLRKLLIAFPFVVCLIAHECLFSKMRFCFRQEKKRKIGFQFVIVTITRKYLSFFERYQNEPLSFRSFNNFICVFYLFLWIIIAIFCIILKKLIQF